jgi:hypothetical protein
MAFTIQQSCVAFQVSVNWFEGLSVVVQSFHSMNSDIIAIKLLFSHRMSINVMTVRSER